MFEKKLYCLIITLFILIIYAVHANAALVSFNTSETSIEINPNESFAIDVFVQEDDSLGDLVSYGFYVDPDASLSLISFNGYTISNPDYDDLGSENYIDGFKNNIETNAGENVLLATLFFISGNSVGTDVLYIQGLISEFDGLFYDFSESDIAASIDINVVPITGSIWLISFGLLGLVGINKKRNKYS